MLDHGCKESIVEAAAFGRIERVEEFLNDDPGLVNTNEGRTPLHEAAGRGHSDILKLLLAHGADRTNVDSNGLTPLDWATRGQQNQIIAILKPEDIESAKT